MVGRVLKALNFEIRGLHEAAYLLGGFALLSQLLALFRDRLFAHAFGAGPILDTYYAAFRVPDFIFAVVVSLVSAYVLIPFLAERLQVSKESANQLLGQTVSFFLILVGGVSLLALFFTQDLLMFAVPGLSHSPHFADLVLLTRILLLQPILLGLSSIVGAVTQLSHRFVLYSLSPLLYNFGIIVGLVFFYPLWGIPGLGIGVALGALLHLLMQVPVLFREGYRIIFPLPSREVLQMIGVAVPRALALSGSQITLLVLVAFASFFATGSIAVFTLALNLQSVPLSIIAVSYSVAAFPTLAGYFARKENNEFLQHMSAAVRHIIFWSMPAIVLFIVLRAQIVRVILGSGAFSWEDTRLTAAALALFVASLLGQGLNLLFMRAYYAAGRTLVPSAVSAIGSLLTIGFAFLFALLFKTMPLFQHFLEALFRVQDLPGTDVLMLPLAYTVGTLIMLVLFSLLFRRDFGALAETLPRVLLQSFGAAVIGGYAAYQTLTLVLPFVDTDTFFGIFTQGFAGGVVGLLITGIVLLLLKNTELLEILAASSKRFLRPRDVPPGQDLLE